MSRLKVGFKTGPKSWQEGRRLVEDYGAKMAEIWYRVDRPEDYVEPIAYLQKHQVEFGFHYWGVVENGLLPSFCHENRSQYDAGLISVKRAIDAAADAGAVYVNIHPGSRVLTRIDSNFERLTLVEGPPTDEQTATELLIMAALELDSYAKERGVTFLVETVPQCDAAGWEGTYNVGRQKTLASHHASLAMISAVAANGVSIANDFGHTAASRPSDDLSQMWHDLRQATTDLAPMTRLIHANTNKAPFNGTDSHDGLLPEDWREGVFPNERQFLELLANFRDRDDVWIVPEPKPDQMIANYLALKNYCANL